MILGDFLLVILMGFYAGVGIWESGSVRHILGMLLPAAAVWFLMASVLKLYSGFPREFVKAGRLRRLPKLWEQLLSAQKIRTLIVVWGVTCIAACFWQAFYWRHILRSQSYFYRFRLGTVIWYAGSYGSFFFLWRAFWTVFTSLLLTAAENKGLRICSRIIFCLLAAYAAAAILINIRYRPMKYTVDTVPGSAPRTALVFGAGVYLNGEPSAVLVDRVATAVDLYKKGLIDEMIMSGDNSDASRNEVDHMIRLAVDSGVPEEAVLRDDRGVHTAESCWNAKNEFEKDEVIFVSQDFHAVRILMTAKSYGLTGIAVRADRRIYNIFSWGMWYLLDLIRLPVYFVHYF